MKQLILHRPSAPAIITVRSHGGDNQHLVGRSPQGAGPPTGWTRPLGPSLLTTPLLRLKRFSISPSLAPRSRMTSTSRIMPDVRNLLPCPPDSPRLSNSSSASRDSLSRASSAERTALLDGDGNTGAPPCSWRGCDDVVVVGDAVDEGEYVGLGWTTPICRSRSARPGWRLSAGFGDMCGSEPSRRIAVHTHTPASLAAALPIGPGAPVWEREAVTSTIVNGPSSFDSDAFGAWAFLLGDGLDAAAALDAEDPEVGGGTADPGALFGNLRMVFCAADLDAPEPIVTWIPCLGGKWALDFRR